MEEILIVEDDADLREILRFNLERAGYRTCQAGSAENGLEMMSDGIQLILLDVMLPGMSGYEMARVLREKGFKTPVIFLTARSSEEDLLSGFASGGDDYMSKPFSTPELLARIGAVLKRTSSLSSGALSCGPLTVDLNAEKVFLDGTEVLFSRKEYEILAFLIRNPGTLFTRSQIIKALWLDAPFVIDRTVDVHIAHIRSKLDKHKGLLVSRVGFGYGLKYEK
ncbi:MAG: response regulator transcription factor [Bacteroidales bacterium]|nr:response regulator transcription factor [Bacteroidales bacterium]